VAVLAGQARHDIGPKTLRLDRRSAAMCGIVGAISAKPIDSRTIAEMRDSMAHRGPDHAGLWSATDSRVCLGHRRLAIVDLNAEANQPFISHDGRFIITFNGESIIIGAWLRSSANTA